MSGTEYSMERIDAMEGHEFEHFTATLLRKLRYENVEVTRGSGDQGVDVLAEKEGVRYAVQCKCYSSDLGNTPVQEVNTGKVIYHCHVGIVVTNRYFTQGAKEAAKATGVLLWDRDKLQELLAKTDLMSDTSSSTKPQVKRVSRRDYSALSPEELALLAKKHTTSEPKLLKTGQEVNEVYKQVILSYLFSDPEFVATADRTMERILRPAYPNELWSAGKVRWLLNDLEPIHK